MVETTESLHTQVDFAMFAALAADERKSQKLLDRTSGGEKVAISYIRTPAGKGSPEGLHTHDFEQIFYVLSGEMNVEIDGAEFRAPTGTMIRFPKGVPHRNWNDVGAQDTVHLAINVPAPVLGVPAAKPVT